MLLLLILTFEIVLQSQAPAKAAPVGLRVSEEPDCILFECGLT